MSPGSYCTIIITIILTNILGDVHSDVISSTQSISLMSSPRKPCKIPSSKQLYYMSFKGNRLEPNESIDGCGKAAVHVKCFDPTRIIKPNDFAVCFDGQWYPSQHTCVEKTCAPMFNSYSTHYTCRTPRGVEGSCAEPAEPGTKMTIRCDSMWYRLNDDNVDHETVCMENGKWEKAKVCQSVCGLDLNNNTSLGGFNLKVPNQSYWHVVIFRPKDGQWDQMCVGTVVSAIMVITSHNCFRGDWNDVGPLKVGVGKSSRDYRNYSLSQVYDVENIIYDSKQPPSIVLLIVDRYIAFSDTVGKVCIDWYGDLKLDGRNGHIVASTKDGNNSALQEVKSLQWMTNEECRSKEEISGNIQANEFCSLSNNHTFLPNDIGAGLVVSSEGFYDMLGLLSGIMLDGQIPVFLNMSNARIRPLINELWKRSDEWLKKTNKNWWIRHKDDSK